MTSRPRTNRPSLLISVVILVAMAFGTMPVRPPVGVVAAESPDLSLEPDHGQPGDELTLRGTRFPADSTGEVRLTLDDSWQADVMTAHGGGFELPLAIPALAPGTYELAVVLEAATDGGAIPEDAAEDERIATVAFTVDEPPTVTEAPTEAPPTETPAAAGEPEIRVAPAAAVPGEAVTVDGAGFPADVDGVVIWVADGSVVAAVHSTTDGRLQAVFAAPDVAAGGYEILVDVAGTQVVGQIEVRVGDPGSPTAVSDATPSPTATDDQGVTGAGTTPATLALSKDKSKYNGYVTATVSGFAPNSSATLRWPREYEITSGADAGTLTTLLDTATTDATGRATFGFRTPLEPLGDYTLTARDRSGGKATDALRVIPRILLNEESGPTTTRLRVYFYGFGPGERIEARWHTTGSTTSGYSVLKTLTVASNGRASSIVTIPRGASVGAHLIVGKVIGVSRSASTPFTVMRSTETVTALAAGDIAACNSTGDEETAAVVAREPGTVLALGDIAYESGTTQQFRDCYDPSWGAFKDRTRPAPGNHEYRTPNASGYFSYFGEAAGDPATGYYSFDLGAWHVISLNSNCAAIGGCGAGSAQEQWLRADLAANPADCTLAYFHHPLFSSGEHGNNPNVRPLWQALYDADADLVLSGHDHHYERFAPQDPQGTADADRGIREFVVGTGGRSHYAVDALQPNSEASNGETYGVLRLVLAPTGYSWTFLPVAGASYSDSGATTCHDGHGAIAGDDAATGEAGTSDVVTRGSGTGSPLGASAAAGVWRDDRRASRLGRR